LSGKKIGFKFFKIYKMGKVQKNVPSQEEINHLKAQHGTLFQVEVKDSEKNEHIFLFKKIDRFTMAAAMGDSNPIDSSYFIAENTCVWGDTKLFDDVGIFLAVSEQIQSIIGKATATLKKI
jgi:hypothetical protein